MRCCRIFASFLVAIMLAAWVTPAHAELRDLPHITVLADSSLANVLTELGRQYSRQRNITVSSVFDSTAELATQIDEGTPADIFISSHPQWMQGLKQRGSIDVFSLNNLVRNRLVLAASAGSRLSQQLHEFATPVEMLNAASRRSIMVIADPVNTPLGLYTKQAVQALSPATWDYISTHMVRASNAENALYLLENGETSGIIYASGAYNNPEVDVIFTLDTALYAPIIYQAAVVAGENMSYARDFLQYLSSKPAKDTFLKYGFIVE